MPRLSDIKSPVSDDAVFSGYYPQLVRLVRWHLRITPCEAGEIVHDLYCWCREHRYWERFDSNKSTATNWFYYVLRSYVKNKRALKVITTVSISSKAPGSQSYEDILYLHADDERVAVELVGLDDQLGTRKRELWGHLLAGRTYLDIAHAMGIPKRQVHDGIISLRATIKRITHEPK